ncbi:helix-turn-helix domain-containing protein [Hoeflea marina]|nr:helix-turn-helix domain-containing protein [Hoeflea marina]
MSFQTEAYLQRQDAAARTSELDHWMIGLWRRGSGDFDIDGRSIRAQAGQLHLQSVLNSHEGRYNGQEITFLLLPRDALKGLEAPLDLRCKTDSSNAFHPLLHEYIRILWDKLPDALPGDFAAIGDATLAMVRACMMKSPDFIAAANAPIIATQLALAKKLIAAQLESPALNAQTVANQLAMSRRQLCTIFEPEGGVDRFIRASRLKVCRSKIAAAGNDQTIVSIANALGFDNMASFGRQFRSQFGLSPSEVKGLGVTPPGPERFAEWAKGRLPS